MQTNRKPTKHQWEKLNHLANRYALAEPWKMFSDMDLFALKRPSTEEMVFPLIMGCGEEFFGLSIYRGKAGLGHYFLTQSEMDTDNPIFMAMYNNLLLSFMERGYLEKQDLASPGVSELKINGRNMWPQFRKMRCMRINSAINRDEADLFIEIIPLVLDVAEFARQNKDVLDVFDEISLPLFTKTKPGEWVPVDLENMPGALDNLESITCPYDQLHESCAKELATFKKYKQQWQVGWKVMPGLIGTDPEDMATMAVVQIIDKKNGLVKQFRPISPEQPEELWPDFWKAFLSMVTEEGHLPSVIEVSDPLIAEAFEAVDIPGVKIVERPWLPEMEEAFDFVASQMMESM